MRLIQFACPAFVDLALMDLSVMTTNFLLKEHISE